MRKVHKIKLVFFDDFRKLELFPKPVPGNISQNFLEVFVPGLVFFPIFFAQKNKILILIIKRLDVFDEFLGISPEPFPNRSEKAGVNAYAHSANLK
jgi:hypothetical protein